MSNLVLHAVIDLMPRGTRALYVSALGSRGHGTSVDGSDWDLFAVTARPAPAYVSLAGVPTSDGTRFGDGISVVFLDLRHAAAMATSGNLTIHEASRSPVVLHDECGVGGFLRGVSGACAKPRVLASYHRTQMGRVRRAMSLRGAETAKTWVQLLRECLAARHVLGTGEPAPMDYRTLVAACTDPELAGVATRALESKLSGDADGPGEEDRHVAMAAYDAIWSTTGLMKGTATDPPPGVEARADAFLAATLLG